MTKTKGDVDEVIVPLEEGGERFYSSLYSELRDGDLYNYVRFPER
jgi:hypothetical protein